MAEGLNNYYFWLGSEGEGDVVLEMHLTTLLENPTTSASQIENWNFAHREA